ncbi:MAG TPA: N,N-dimethylformamidase beta subunit family domain-containing protein [Thermoanaerobaculia bacterium]|nr:N,N-dimethylformamidase beta subunit family domain-containing protein [Thermoanaerobaculia bacterium]
MKTLATWAAVLLLAAYAGEVRASNPIQIENAKPGTEEWKLYDEHDSGEIEGYASAISVNRGQSINFYVSTIDSIYTMDVFRMGWYGGKGGRRMLPTITRAGFRQVIPAPAPDTGIVECHWTDPYTITIPNDWVSGFYLVKLTAVNLRLNKFILFIVREDGRPSNYYYQYAVTTSQAYNEWGGKSLYGFNSTDGVAAKKISLDRPNADGSGAGIFLYRWDFNMVRFLEREGYDVSYFSDVDTHERPSELLNHKAVLSVGHDEYWSSEMRDAWEAAIAAKVNAGFFTANTCYWQIRFEPNSSGVPDRTVVGYKETAATKDPYAIDGNPANDKYVTTKFRENPVNRPEAKMIGVQYVYNPVDFDIKIDDVTSAPWVFTNTGLVKGSVLSGLLGYEVDAMDNAYTPAGTIRLGHSPFSDENGTQTIYSDMVVRTAPSGATVFATGSIQWAWGVDNWNNGKTRVNPAAQQITRNVLQRLAGSGAANDCLLTLSPSSADVTKDAGSGSITVTRSQTCGAWTAVSDSAWLHVTVAGNTVNYQYDQNPGATRTGTITIGDKAFTLVQHDCLYSLASNTVTKGSSGGGATITVTTQTGCTWTTISNVPWITVASGASQTGSGTASLSVAPNQGPDRTGTVTVAQQTFTVTQFSGCFYSISPLSATFAPGGGNGSYTMTSGSPDCPWGASSNANWITLTSSASGSGSTTVTYTVAANAGPARDGKVSIGGKDHLVHQDDGCVFTVTPSTVTFSYDGGAATIDVTTNALCAWSATSNAPWLVITGGASGTGSAKVSYEVQPNGTGMQRSGTMTIAGKTVTVTQTSIECTFSITPMFASFGPAAGTGTIQVAASTQSCVWSATVESGGDFLFITSTGPSSVSYSVKDNPGAEARTGTIRIGGEVFQVTQNAAGSTPITLTATATGSTSVLASWSAEPGASSYEVFRSQGGALVLVGSTSATSFNDTSVQAGAAYLYRVRALTSAGVRMAYSNVDLATTFTFTDPSLAPGSVIRAAHLEDLRAAVDALRATIGLPPVAWTDPVLAGVVVKSAHVLQLRTAINEVRAAIGLAPATFSSPLTLIKAVHIEEMRNAVR